MLRKPSVARGTKIVDKMVRQIEREIDAFEKAHADLEKAHNKADAKASRALRSAVRVDSVVTALSNAMYRFAVVIADKAYAVSSKARKKQFAKQDAIKDKMAEHTADLGKLERIRDKVATLAD